MEFELHKNELGSFQELAHKDDVEFGQLSMLKVAPHKERGGHYHTRKNEWFACIRGKCVMKMVDVVTGVHREIELDCNHTEFKQIYPYESHKVINYYNEECELLVIISEPYDPNDHDTIKYEVE